VTDWYPGAKRSLTFPGSGSYVFGPYRGVLHSTEGSSLAGALGAYRSTGNYPHFTVDGATIEQHCPINVGATALEHRSGTIDTNRASAIQIEIVGKAAEAPGFPPALIANLAELMRWVEEQTGISFAGHRVFASTPVRMTDAEWAHFNSWCGHQHVPNQSHWDPGALLIDKLAPKNAAAPTSQVIVHPPIEFGDQVFSQRFTTPALDAQGRGWIMTNIPVAKVFSIVPLGPAPQRDGYDGPWNIPVLSKNDTGGVAEIAIEEANPGSVVSFEVWYTA
jgi:hypothetical protein